ncbi:MAG: hypothetical protein M3198_07110 [Actinomycetota bacterium]|nr:hypothetical protein [Actinomycetota bacterium]
MASSVVVACGGLGLFYAFELARQAAIDAYDKKKAEQANQKAPKKPAFVKLLVRRKPHEAKSSTVAVPPLNVAVGAAAVAAPPLARATSSPPP